MRVPRDVSSSELIKVMGQYEYIIIRQTGSHIRLSKSTSKGTHNITVPNHNPIKIGTLQKIAEDICEYNKLEISNFYSQL